MDNDVFTAADGRKYELRNLRVQQPEKEHALHVRVGNGAYSELPHHEIYRLYDFLGQWLQVEKNGRVKDRLLHDSDWNARIAGAVASALDAIGANGDQREVNCVMVALMPEIAALLDEEQ